MDLEKMRLQLSQITQGKTLLVYRQKGNSIKEKEHGGEFSNFLNEQVPDNKKWEIVITVNITETDV